MVWKERSTLEGNLRTAALVLAWETHHWGSGSHIILGSEGACLEKEQRRRKEVRLSFLRIWGISPGFEQGIFLGYYLEEISLRFREEVRLSFVRIWGISPCFEGAFLRLLLEGSVRVLKRLFGAAIRVISPGFWNRILGFLQGWSIQVFERAFWGCYKGDQFGFLKEHFGAIVRMINPGFWKSILGLL